MATPASRTERIDRIDLARLNEAERSALDLLAEGHTVKSIAVSTGQSVGAINERLREARRKTGIGSSRELARLFRAQKNRDEKIGVAGAAGAGASKGPEAASARRGGRPWKGPMLMGAIIAGVAAAALLLQGTPERAPGAGAAASDPLLGGLVAGTSDHPSRLHGLLRAEERDARWAPAIETALKQRYARIPGIGGAEGLRVICATTLCEVAGPLDEGPTPDATNATMQILQGEALRDDVAKLGLDSGSMGFGSDKGLPGTGVFVAYWKRADG